MRFIDYRTQRSSTLPLRELPLDAVAVLDHLGTMYLVRQPETGVIVGVWDHHCGAGLSALAFLPGTYQFQEEGNPTDWHSDQQLNHATECFRTYSEEEMGDLYYGQGERSTAIQAVVADMERQQLDLPSGCFAQPEDAWWDVDTDGLSWAEAAPHSWGEDAGIKLRPLQASYFRALQHLHVPEFGLLVRSRDLERQWLTARVRGLLSQDFAGGTEPLFPGLQGVECNVFGYCLWGHTNGLAEGYCVQLPERMRSTDISAVVAALRHLGCVPEFELDGRWLHAEFEETGVLPLRTCEEVSDG